MAYENDICDGLRLVLPTDECRRAGFGEVQSYGGHDFRPYVEGGDLIAVARKE